jgi:multidrug efflux pump subunit AcrA (membrane-fusion protein)
MSTAHICWKPSILLLAALALAAAGCDDKHPAPVATPPPVVEVAVPVQRDVTDYQVFTARTQAVKSVDVKARVTGYLKDIKFKDGDLVEENKTVLFKIDDSTYKASLDEAKAALDVAKSSLDVAKSSLDVAKAGLDVAKANLVKTQADYDIGLKVQKDNPGAISEQEITRRLGARDEAKGGIEKAKASIEQAKGGIEEAKGGIKKAEAALEKAQQYYDWCTVKAPLSGRISRHLVDIGNLVNQDITVLANIVSLEPMWAYINVDQNTVRTVQALVREGKVKSAREGHVPVEMGVGVGSEQSFPIAGAIDYVSNQLDPSTGTVQVRAEFPNKDQSLVAGLFARIKVPVAGSHPALLVADRAIGTDQGQKYLLIVNDKDEVEYRAVEVGLLHDGLREVLRFRSITEPGADGKAVEKQVEVLKPTDRVIVLGMQRARPGDKVEPKLVDMQTWLSESSTAPK